MNIWIDQIQKWELCYGIYQVPNITIRVCNLTEHTDRLFTLNDSQKPHTHDNMIQTRLNITSVRLNLDIFLTFSPSADHVYSRENFCKKRFTKALRVLNPSRRLKNFHATFTTHNRDPFKRNYPISLKRKRRLVKRNNSLLQTI